MFLTINALGQYPIEGVVYDPSTRTPISFAHVYSMGESAKGTVTNEDGHFQIVVDNPNTDSLSISFIGYSTKEIAASSLTGHDTVWLEGGSLKLREILVVEKSTNSIIDNVIEKLRLNHSLAGRHFRFYSRVAYINPNDRLNLALFETVGRIFVRRKKMRFALEGIDLHYNHMYKLRFTSILKLNYANPLMWRWSFLRKSKKSDYEYESLEDAEVDGKMCYKMRFASKRKDDYFDAGELVIDKMTFALLRLELEHNGVKAYEVDYVPFEGKFVPYRSIERTQSIYNVELLTVYNIAQPPTDQMQDYIPFIVAEKIKDYLDLGGEAVDRFCTEFNCPPIPERYREK